MAPIASGPFVFAVPEGARRRRHPSAVRAPRGGIRAPPHRNDKRRVVPRFLRALPLLPACFALAGCNADVLSPSGWVAGRERDLLLISTFLMLLIAIPVIAMAIRFPMKYRAGRPDASDYDPDFTHSWKIEAAVWGAPIVIVAILGWLTWDWSHRLDPYRPLPVAGAPIRVQAVSMDWKWLFIYPDYDVATVNRLPLPVGRPVEITLASSTVMNTLSIPALAGMVYAMPGMQTKLHLIADHEGVYQGRSAHYSGPGFTGMAFDATAMNAHDFEAFVHDAKGAPALTRARYLDLEKPSQNVAPFEFGSVAPDLFQRIRDLCVEGDRTCISDMMAQDRAGGGGLKGAGEKSRYAYDDARAVDGFGALLPQGATIVPAVGPTDAPIDPKAEASHAAH